MGTLAGARRCSSDSSRGRKRLAGWRRPRFWARRNGCGFVAMGRAPKQVGSINASVEQRGDRRRWAGWGDGIVSTGQQPLQSREEMQQVFKQLGESAAI